MHTSVQWLHSCVHSSENMAASIETQVCSWSPPSEAGNDTKSRNSKMPQECCDAMTVRARQPGKASRHLEGCAMGKCQSLQAGKSIPEQGNSILKNMVHLGPSVGVEGGVMRAVLTATLPQQSCGAAPHDWPGRALHMNTPSVSPPQPLYCTGRNRAQSPSFSAEGFA